MKAINTNLAAARLLGGGRDPPEDLVENVLGGPDDVDGTPFFNGDGGQHGDDGHVVLVGHGIKSHLEGVETGGGLEGDILKLRTSSLRRLPETADVNVADQDTMITHRRKIINRKNRKISVRKTDIP